MDKIVIDGKEFTTEELQKKIKELESGYLRQEDYTKKTQELAEERKKIEELSKSIQEKQEELAAVIELAQILDENPQFADKVQKIAEEYKKNGTITEQTEEEINKNANNIEPVINELMEKVKNLEEERKQELLRKDYENIVNSINSAIEKSNIEFNNLQKDVIQKAAWMIIMEETAKTKKIPSQNEIATKVNDIIQNTFPNAKKIESIKKNINPTGYQRSEQGGIGINVSELPNTGTIDYTKKAGEIFKKIKETYNSGG